MIAEALVVHKLAACVNIIPAVQSIYLWEGELENSPEHLLIIKSSRSCYPALEEALRELHPYELPEIIAVPLTAGLPDYLNWIGENIK